MVLVAFLQKQYILKRGTHCWVQNWRSKRPTEDNKQPFVCVKKLKLIRNGHENVSKCLLSSYLIFSYLPLISLIINH